MSRVAKVLLTVCALTVAAAFVAACGTKRISVPQQDANVHQGALLFNQRCSGCHTLSYATAQGSAFKVGTKQFNNGPSFDVRCERPITRVIYAIQNGGFSGAIMPQNIVVGQDTLNVAKFVATYAGRQSPRVPGVVPCAQQPVGTVPAIAPGGTSTAATTARAATKKTSQSAGPAGGTGKSGQTKRP